MFDKILESCTYLLNNFPEAQLCKDYLNKRLNEDSQKTFEFGYIPNINNIKSITSIVGEDELKKNKLLFSREIEDSLFPRTIHSCYFEDYPLIMPFKDPYGKVVALVGRTLLSDEERSLKQISKYKNTQDFKKGNYVFGLFENKKSILEKDCVYVVEGQFDVIKSVESGLTNIVALGSSNMSYYQLSLIARYTNNIFLLLDNDEAGEKGRKRIIDKFGKLSNIRNMYLPDPYKDIDEFFSQNSYDDLSFIIKD